MDRSEGRETRCNAIFSFVFTGGIFYHEDKFLRGDGSQGKCQDVLFLANGVSWGETPLCLQADEAQHRTNTAFTNLIYFWKPQVLNRNITLAWFLLYNYIIKGISKVNWNSFECCPRPLSAEHWVLSGPIKWEISRWSLSFYIKNHHCRWNTQRYCEN